MPVKNSIWKFLNNDWHFLLLIIFFIMHGYAEHVGLIPVVSLLLLFIVLTSIALLLFWLCRRIIKNRQRAALFITLFLLVFLFFGAFQDFLGRFRFTASLAQLKIFVPVSLAVILLAFILLKRSRHDLTRWRVFLIALLALSILIDVVTISAAWFSSSNNKQKTAMRGWTACDTCSKPPVYFILLDEYSGSHALKDFFNYDNTRFEQFLASEGFKVSQRTTSNYLLTVFSLASTMSMDYIHDLGPVTVNNHYGYRKAVNLLGDNAATHVLQQHGYGINNYSYFRLPDVAPEFKGDYLPGDADLITHKTLYSRVAPNVTRLLINRFGIRSLQERSDNYYIQNNEAMMRRTLNVADEGSSPSFTYLHLMMPHDPIAFDSLGRRITPFWARPRYALKERDEAYLQYLVYTNNRLRTFITALKQRTKGEAIIMVMSDHGYRRIPLNKELRWQTLNAIYLPQQYHEDYNKWYDGMSNVNQFRILFNTMFDQQLPMLRDSLVK